MLRRSKIKVFEKSGEYSYIFGYEESYGCLIAPFARDKDGLQAITLYTEMANYYDKKGMTLDMVWEMIGEKYGYHQDEVYNMPFFGPEGAIKMKNLMDILHNQPFISIGGLEVVKAEDYLISKSFTKVKGLATTLAIFHSSFSVIFLTVSA